jgi:hypothetical protein
MIYPEINYFYPGYPDGAARMGPRELDSRAGDGIRVALFWSEAAGRVWVTVTDTKTGEVFSVPVLDGERALDVFHHPYAYAAARGVPIGGEFPPNYADVRRAA